MLALTLALCSFVLPLVEAPCQPDWIPTFGGQLGVPLGVYDFAAYDDGSGPALFVGGEFATAGGHIANHIAKWDGSDWSVLGAGTEHDVLSLAVHDDGSGSALYVGGAFTAAGGIPATYIARWDGTNWSPVGGGMNGDVHTLVVHDDGNGPALYAGGDFTMAGGVSANRIAKWNGANWSRLGNGTSKSVETLAVFDDGGGSGPQLYAGGTFAMMSGVVVNRIGRWDGTAWSIVGGGVDADVFALTVHDDGGGPALYAGGGFATAGGNPAAQVAKWDGSTWSALGSGVVGPDVLTLASYDDGGGAELFVGGSFVSAGGLVTNDIAKWDGSAWATLGSGAGSGDVHTLGVWDDGNGLALYAGGHYMEMSGVFTDHVSKWDGTSWSALGNGMGRTVYAVAEFDDGSGTGPQLIAGGSFSVAGGGVVANRVARWDGASWSTMGAGIDNTVWCFGEYDSGSGPELYAGGSFFLERWTGSAWVNAGTVNSSIKDIHVWDDGGGADMYVAGAFTSIGGASANRVARWNGSNWSSLGSGMDFTVEALVDFDDGNGSALYAGGTFFTAGGGTVNRVAKWDGTSWSGLGLGMDSTVESLAVYDDGSGPVLYAGGHFTMAGGLAANGVARWDGTSWSSLGVGLAGLYGDIAEDMVVYDDGNGPALFVAGNFDNAGGLVANNVARWDGSSWSVLGDGLFVSAFATTTYDDGTGRALIVCGSILASPAGDSYIARWGGCTGQETYCTAGISANGCQAGLSASGVASATAASGFDLQAMGVEGSKDGLFFYGANGRQANSWGSGTSYQCVVPPVRRAGLLSGGGTSGFCDGAFTQDLNARWTAKPAHNPGAGALVQAQLWYRDPLNTSNQTTSLSDAIEFAVGP
jgi:hypothetical protein